MILQMRENEPQLIETPLDRIEVRAEFVRIEPAKLFDFWIQPDLLKKWWPPEVEIEPLLGGRYHFSWPKQSWHLRGKITEFEMAKRLGLTWRWDHEPQDVTEVRVLFSPGNHGGTELVLHQGTYALNEDGKRIRDGHVEGWLYFLGKLQERV